VVGEVPHVSLRVLIVGHGLVADGKVHLPFI
jgi:hypothetical protein